MKRVLTTFLFLLYFATRAGYQDTGPYPIADGGALKPVGSGELPGITTDVKTAQRQLYRRIAGMDRREKIDAGAYVYFTFLRPFAETAGVDDRLDWTVPRDSLEVYEGLATLEKMPDVESDDSIPYYTPVPETGVSS